jgi:hypothetical protein
VQGKDLLELLQIFRQTTTQPFSSFVLETPKHKSTEATEPPIEESHAQGEHQNSSKYNQIQSLRLKVKANKSKPIIKMAQEVVAKKWGILKEDKELDNMTL